MNIIEIFLTNETKPVLTVADMVFPQVLELAKTLGIKIYTHSETVARGYTVNKDNFAQFTLVTKEISLCDNCNKSNDKFFMSLALLHEVIHWTGHHHNLGRQTVIDSMLRPWWVTFGDVCTEEITAELGSFKLGVILGIETKDFQANRDKYIRHFAEQGGNFDLAQMQADNAIMYVMRRFGELSKQAA